MDTHPTPERLREYHGGLLGAEEGLALEAHLDDCPDCARAYGRLLARDRPGSDGTDGAPPRPLSLPADLEGLLKQLGAPGCPWGRPIGGPFPAFDGYDIIEEVGRGGMGVVYRAIDLAHRRVVAIKTIASGDFPSPEEADRFHQEAEALTQLSAETARVVRVFDHGVCRGLHYLSMEYVAGGALSARLAAVLPAPQEAARLIADVADTAHHLHQQGIIHRDIKPGNILLEPPPGAVVEEPSLASCRPLLADFGLIKKVEGANSRRTQTGQILGTPGFMPPEMIRSSKDAGPAVDIYSLGATLYTCLTQSNPFPAATPFETLKRVEKDYPTRPSRLNRSVPAPLERICLKCLEKDPRRRYASAADLATDLRRFLAADPKDPVQARAPALWLRAGRWMKANLRTTLAAAFGLLVASLLVLAVAFSLKRLEHESDRRTAAERLVEVERQRAATERNAAHAARVTASQQFGRRGDWLAGLPAYDSAIADEDADALRLRVERLVGYFALNETAKLTDELDELNRLDLGDDLKPQVQLLHGAWLLCDSAKEEQGRVLVREALKNRGKLFSEADIAFAEALVSERLGQALAALRRALEADPLHYLAASSMPAVLAAAGEREELRRHTRFLRGVFPSSPVADIANALVAFLEGNRAELTQELAQAAARWPKGRRPALARLEQFLLLLIDVQDINARLCANVGFDVGGEAPRAIKILGKAMQVGGIPNGEPLALPVPTFSVLRRRGFELFSVYRDAGPLYKAAPVPDELLRRLEVLNEDAPDAWLLLMTAVIHMQRSIDPVNQGDVTKARAELLTAAELCTRATNAPCVLPRSTVPYTARGVAMACDVGVLKLVRDPDPAHLRRVRESLHLLVSEGAKWRGLRQGLISGFVAMITAPLLPEQCGDWKLDEPEGKKAFAERKRALATLAQALLDDWAIDEPNNFIIPRFREGIRKWAASSGVLDASKAAPPKR